VEIPLLRDLYDDLKSENFELLGVASEPESDVRGFLSEVPVNYPVLLDDDGRVASAYAVQVYPSILIVDPEGNITSISHGLNPLLKWKVRWMVTGNPF
jgi:peroxiredoxin